MDNESSIAIDGPAASGKTTVGRALAHRLGYRFVDTGAMYRAVTLAALNENVDLYNKGALTKLAETMRIEILANPDGDRLLVNELDVTDNLRDRAVDLNVSQVSAVRGVRTALVRQQRKLGQQGSIVMVGRDIGTVVLADSRAKIYLDASVEVRANRRYLEAQEDSGAVDYHHILDDLINRDRIDTQRAESPLVPADGALILDTKGMTIEQVVEAILNELKGR